MILAGPEYLGQRHGGQVPQSEGVTATAAKNPAADPQPIALIKENRQHPLDSPAPTALNSHVFTSSPFPDTNLPELSEFPTQLFTPLRRIVNGVNIYN